MGSGKNGAIIHYRPVKDKSEKVSPKIPFLCDTGAHYLSGTTDTTRTILFEKNE